MFRLKKDLQNAQVKICEAEKKIQELKKVIEKYEKGQLILENRSHAKKKACRLLHETDVDVNECPNCSSLNFNVDSRYFFAEEIVKNNVICNDCGFKSTINYWNSLK